MSARRRYTIVCNGPSCSKKAVTEQAFVYSARAQVRAEGWWKVGESTERAMDFCSEACETEWEALFP